MSAFVVSEESVERFRELLAPEHAYGVEHGRQWAMGFAEPEELNKLTEDCGNCVLTFVDQLDYWVSVSVESPGQRSHWTLKGFIAGALEVWGQVKERLAAADFSVSENFTVSETSVKRHREWFTKAHKIGVDAGRSWAMEGAHAAELDDLQHDGNVARLFSDEDDPAEFWMSVFKCPEPTVIMVEGFVEGALEAWVQIKARLGVCEK